MKWNPFSKEVNNPLPSSESPVTWLVEQLETENKNIAKIIGMRKYNKIVKQALFMEQANKK